MKGKTFATIKIKNRQPRLGTRGKKKDLRGEKQKDVLEGIWGGKRITFFYKPGGRVTRMPIHKGSGRCKGKIGKNEA